MRHHHAAQLRWSDPDMLGHVNHARALSPLDDDEREFWTSYEEDET